MCVELHRVGASISVFGSDCGELYFPRSSQSFLAVAPLVPSYVAGCVATSTAGWSQTGDLMIVSDLAVLDDG